MRPLYLKGKEGSKDLVCYVPGGVYWGAQGRITGPDKGWIAARDLRFCERINAETGFGVYCRAYDVRGSYDARLGFYKPYDWIRNIYTFAQANGYENLHLVGFSGGGSLASSQLLYYADQMVRSLVIISGPVANNPKAVHVNAAYYADQITTRTLLVYGEGDGYRSHADVWRRNNPAAALKEYRGGHDFQPQLGWVVEQVVDWQKRSKRAVLLTKKRRRKRKSRQLLELL
jgi:pimeloyl-ACP methyl ester carboxylesterase